MNNATQILTDDEIDARRVPTGKFSEWESGSYQYRRAFARAIEQAVLSKLRGAGEPVAYQIRHPKIPVWRECDRDTYKLVKNSRPNDVRMLYAAPQASAEAIRNAALEEAAGMVGGTNWLADDGDVPALIARHIRALKSAPAVEGEDFPSDLAGRLREYASNNGYSHQDYADTLRKAADALDRQQRGGDVAALREALKFYADQDHFIITDDDAWDTVSGEPQNFFCDEAGTATVEDGSIARAALAAQKPDVVAVSLAASASNPAHISVGAVILGPEGGHVVHRRPDGVHSYMTETVEPGETLTDAVRRGAMEEMGMGVAPLRYLGSTTSSGLLGRDYTWQKTTLWFECRVLADYGRRTGELDSAIVVVNPGASLQWDEVRTPFGLAAQKPVEGELTLRQQYEDACIAANANARDAERYRFLRDADRSDPVLPYDVLLSYAGTSLDEAIDAAIARQGKEGA